MTRTVAAIYENGALRLLEPLALEERQTVTVTISESADEVEDAWLDHEYIGAVEAIDEPEPTLADVRSALSSLAGNLSDDIRRERDARG